MSVKGVLKADQLTVGKIVIDWMKQRGIQIEVLAGLTDTESGTTRGWVDGTGIVWSENTREALNNLREALENDIAQEHFQGGGSSGALSSGLSIPSGGLGEHIGTTDGVPSV